MLLGLHSKAGTDSSSVTTVRVEGLSVLVRQLESLGVSVADLKDTMGQISVEAAELARGFAPVRSGALRASIRGNRAKGRATVTAGNRRVVYASVIEWGWPARHITPAGYMQRTQNVIGSRAPVTLQKGIDRLIRQAGLG